VRSTAGPATPARAAIGRPARAPAKSTRNGHVAGQPACPVHGGIDEAGRGPVMGPLVVAGVACADPAALHRVGCRDSKTLSPARRVRLARLLRDDPSVHIEVRSVAPEALDLERASMSLNAIEVRRFRDIACALAEAGARRICVDAADVDADRFGRQVAAGLAAGVRVESRHRADGDDPCVAAASIVAKVARDDAVATLARRLERRIGRPLGTGYPSDPKTQAFLAAWVARHGDLPEGTRRSWRTARDLLAPRPTRLDAFA